jgi:hypothetical protein
VLLLYLACELFEGERKSDGLLVCMGLSFLLCRIAMQGRKAAAVQGKGDEVSCGRIGCHFGLCEGAKRSDGKTK